MGLRTWLGLKKRRRAISSKWEAIETELIQPSFPIDIVYSWVDGRDPDFSQLLEKYRSKFPDGNHHSTSKARFENHDELRYSLRSIADYAPWVNRIFIVTNGQRPTWLAPHPKIRLVTHDEILDPRYLPTFNSHVIGSAIHRIPELAEHYVYFNDDVMLMRPLKPTNFFSEHGLLYATRTTFVLEEESENDDLHAAAAANARALIFREWNVRFDHRFGHTFHPQLRSIALECEDRFAVEFDAFRRNRFRSPNDVLCCSFLYPYVAYLRGRALFKMAKTWYVKVRAASAPRMYRRMLRRKGSRRAVDSVCLNDSGTGTPLDYERRLKTFLESYYPNPSPFERADRRIADAGQPGEIGNSGGKTP
jgi:hypothetical protein